ncbi:MAG: ATPase, T2SS/T4P/T4SS family, partial [Nanoarchaeota archaeon]
MANPSKLVTLVEYTEKNLKAKLEQFMKKAKKGIFVKRLPIEFTHNQVEYVEYRQRSDGKKKSFNATVREIIEDAKLRKDGFIEIERACSTIVQLGLFRIVITRPPFSDGWEITAVRPVRKLNLSDYKLSDKLMKRVAEQAEGVLVAGAPGMGKTTFAQSLAEYYSSQDKIVKTVEAPRDLILPERITQYAISYGNAQEIHDILLLSRPDYTIFDEMRNTDDFKLFADLRLAGVGMVGVVHATSPVDAIQRFIGRVEMGVIPQVIDTVIFIKNGFINKVLSLKMTVKVPSGMTEADLARPVVVVNDFETSKLEYEIYSYGEQTVVIPVQEGREKSGAHKLAETTILAEFQKYSRDAEVEVLSDNKCVVYVPESDIARIIGKQGVNI